VVIPGRRKICFGEFFLLPFLRPRANNRRSSKKGKHIMMTAAHIARLRQDVQSYVDRERRPGKAVAFSAIKKHVLSLGWNLADGEMFAGWVRSNISGTIDYKS